MTSRSGWVGVFIAASLSAVLLLTSIPLLAKGFQTGPPEYPTGVGPAFVITADTRGKGPGFQDLIVSNPDINGGTGAGNTISVLLSNGDGTYKPAVSYTVGTTPIAIAAADFNKDGKLDLAVANANAAGATGTISLLLGNGDGTFNAATSISVGANPVGVFAADLNGDGFMDMVVTNSDLFGTDSCASSSLTILLNNKAGGFTSSPAQAGLCPLDAAIVDLGNGNLDLLVANSGGMNSNAIGNISVLIGNGNGTFQTAVNYPVGSRPQFVTVADFNKDGKLDVAVSDQGAKNNGTNGGISLLLGNGNGTLQKAASVPGITRADNLVAGDFNKDAKMDLAGIGKNNGSANIFVILGNGDGTFKPAQTVGLSGLNFGLAAADLNNDGELDLAVPVDFSPGPGDVAVLLGVGDGTFQGTITSYSFNASPQAIAVSDFNNDQKPDLAVGITTFTNCTPGPCTVSSSVEALLGAGNGTFTQSSPIGLPGNATGVATGIFKTGGSQDIVVSQNNQSGNGFLSYLQGNGNGTFQAPANTSLSINPFQIAAADFNKDSNLDVVMGSCGGLDYFLGNGNGTFGGVNPLPANGFCVGGQVATGDLNGDGFPDIVVTNVNTGNLDVYVYLNNGNSGGFTGPTVYSLGAGPSTFQVLGAALGHFKESTAAGHLDIAVTNPVTNKVTILTNNGDGTFTVGNSYAVGTNPVFIATGNFDGSGHASLAVANCTNCNASNGAGSTVSVLYGNGDGTFQMPMVSYTAGDGTDAVGLGDFNGDGAPDLAVANGNGGTVVILLNTGGTVANPLISSANPSSVGQNVTFTATFTPSVLSVAPTGTVTFKDGNAGLGSNGISNNQAALTINTLSAGTHSITATYSGDANYNPHTTAALSQSVGKSASTTALNAAPNPAVPGQVVTFTATVTPGTGPTGTVNFLDGATTIGSGTLNVSGVATFSNSALASGSHSITAVYVGDSNFAGSTSPVVTQVIQVAATTTNLISSANPSAQGASVTFTATVTWSGGAVTVGSVTFSVDGVAQGSAVSVNGSGQALFSTSALLAGIHTVTAVFTDGSSFSGSTSNNLSEVITASGVTPSNTSAVVAVTPSRPGKPAPGQSANVVRLEQNAHFTVTVSGASGTPTGQVSLQDNGAVIGFPQPLSGGSATFNIHGFTIGTHSIVFIYSGDNIYQASSSSALPIDASPKTR